ncbi:MAG: hypothetical protein AAF297_02195 [Planctomycetota bacterium]
MMTFVRRLACAGLAGGVALLSGCAVPPPQVTPLPSFTPIKAEVEFRPETERVTFRIEPRFAAPDYEQNLDMPVSSGEGIVISVPRPDADDSAEIRGAFSSAAAFNDFEQQVERALIRKDFDLRDRSKFEANLIARGAGDVDGIDSQAELLNAALDEDGTAYADYVLQINEIRTEQNKTKRIDPQEFTEVTAFARRHPGLSASGAIDRFEVPMVEAVFNAKLIRVETGSVVWIGSHRVNSFDLEPTGTTVTLSVTPTPRNLDALAEEAAEYETQLQRLYTSAQRRYNEATDMTNGMSPRGRDQVVAEYERLLGEYKAAVASAPDLGPDRYEYDYKFDRSMSPDLLGFFAENGPSTEALRSHELSLLKLAALESIAVIEVTR